MDATAQGSIAAQGNYDAQFFLGIAYANGQGVARDLVQAYVWLSRAARSSNPDAVRERDQLARRMTPDDLRRAQELARN